MGGCNICVAATLLAAATAEHQLRPNFVIFFVDDLGFNEINVPHAPFGYTGYGGEVKTPNIAKLAAEGMLFMDWYSAWHVCSPSRAAMQTGRLPPRTGIDSVSSGVLMADAVGGLPPNETTFATMLGNVGYTSKIIGKWHLGQRLQFLPTRHGYDEYFGVPFSADMGTSYWHPQGLAPAQPTPLPLLNGTTVVDQPAGLATFASRYVDASIDFIRRSAAKQQPFVLFLSFNHVHNPQVLAPPVHTAYLCIPTIHIVPPLSLCTL